MNKLFHSLLKPYFSFQYTKGSCTFKEQNVNIHFYGFRCLFVGKLRNQDQNNAFSFLRTAQLQTLSKDLTIRKNIKGGHNGVHSTTICEKKLCPVKL